MNKFKWSVNTRLLLSTVMFFVFITKQNAQIQYGDIDNTLNVGTGSNGEIFTVAKQFDNKFLIGGSFSLFNDEVKNCVVRLKNDGTLDDSFISGSGANSAVYTIAVQTDNKIILGGQFTNYAGIAINRLVRLQSNGTIDNTFSVGTGANSNINQVLVQSDGKILIAGNFTSFNQLSLNRLTRLNPDGSVDNSFISTSGLNGEVKSVSILSGGKILITGNFSTYNGKNRSGIAKLNIDGTIDETFNPGTGASNDFSSFSIIKANIQANQKIIIVGQFTKFNNVVKNHIARLNEDGTLDNSFAIGTGFSGDWSMAVYSAEIINTNKIIIGGNFNSYNGSAVKGLVEVDSTGVIKNTFLKGTGLSGTWGATPTVKGLLHLDNKLLVVGEFASYNDIAKGDIVRINLYDKTCAKTYKTDKYVVCSYFKWIDGKTYTQSNNSATYVLSNSQGCDSIVTLDLTMNLKSGKFTHSACDSYKWIDGNTYTSNNSSAKYVYKTKNGCDSVVTLNLTIYKVVGTHTITYCKDYKWIDGKIYTTSNSTAKYTLKGAAIGGCDSTVTLDLTINRPSFVISNNGGTLENYTNNYTVSYQWINCSNNSKVQGATSSFFNPTQNGDYSIIISTENCTDTASNCVKFNLPIWNEVQRFTSIDSVRYKNFGYSIAIDGDFAVVGSPDKDDVNGVGTGVTTYSGFAYVYKKDSNGLWKYVQKIVGTHRSAEDRFGRSVSINGKYIVVGCYNDDLDENGKNTISNSGSIYVFERDASDYWNLKQKIVAPDRVAGDGFGYTVSISGNNIAVGAPWQSVDNRGATYLYELNNTTWVLKQKLASTDITKDDSFGNSVSISGDNLIVGALTEDHDTQNSNSKNNAGSAYVFERLTDGSWAQKQKLVANDRNSLDEFGICVNINGNYAIVGAHKEDENSSGNSTLKDAGSAYIFEKSISGVWEQKQKIVTIDRDSVDFFGFTVAINENHAVVGATYNEFDVDSKNSKFYTGSVYIFNKNNQGIWVQQEKKVTSQRLNSSYFGKGLALYKHEVLAATLENIYAKNIMYPDMGAVYVFQLADLKFCPQNVNILQINDSLTVSKIDKNYQWLDCGKNFQAITGEVNKSFLPKTNGNYAVKVSNNACSDTTSCYNYFTVGIQLNPLHIDVRIYPNPSTKILNLEVPSYEDVEIYIMDATGKQLLNQKVLSEKTAIDVSNFSAGIYYLKISNTSKISTLKFVINEE